MNKEIKSFIRNVERMCIFLLIFTFFISCASIVQYPELYHDDYGPSHYVRRNRAIEEFRAQVDEWAGIPEFRPANIGIYIENPKTREVIYSRNPHKLFMPASNMKLFTTASAIALLGPDYTYKTGLYVDGEIQDSVLKGNLIIRGSGDPTISGRYNNGDALEVFKEWGEALKEKGIKSIDGTIIGDDNIFDDVGLGYSWAWDDESYYYAAQISGLSFNDNCIDLFFVPSKNIGENATIFTYPKTGYIEITNDLITVPADSQKLIDFYRFPGTNRIRIFGTIPINSDTLKDWATVENPTLFILTVFKETLENIGVSINNISDIDDLLIENPSYDKLELIAVHESVPMSEIVKTINKKSQNFYAEQVQKTLGVELKGKGDWKSGINTEKDWFSKIGIDPNKIFIVDGSGLSRHNMVTPFQVATVLRTMKYNSNWKVFFDSLPIGGIDGTLEKRLEGSNAVGHVFAKTGYIGHVRSLSGYVDAKCGKEYIFSIMVNHYPTPTSVVNEMQDAIVTLLYNLDY